MLGVDDSIPFPKDRQLVLNNQLNVVMFIFAVLLSLITYTDMLFDVKDGFSVKNTAIQHPVSLGVIILIATGNLVLNHFRLSKISKPVISFLPLYFLLIYNLQTGYIYEEFYFWYPFAPIPFTLLSILVYDKKDEKFFYWANIIYCVFLSAFASEILNYYSDVRLPIADIVDQNWLFYKVAPIALGLFIFTGVHYLIHRNTNYALNLARKNEELNRAITELKLTQKQLIANEKMAILGRLSSEHSHEMNTPITSIKGNLDALIKDQKIANKLWGKVIHEISKADFQQLKSLMREILQKAREEYPSMVTSADENMLSGQLHAMGVPVDRHDDIIEYFSSFGISDIVPYRSICNHPFFRELLEIAYCQKSVQYSARLSHDAIFKAEQLVRKLRNYTFHKRTDQPVPYDIKQVVSSSIELMRSKMLDVDIILEIEDHLPILNGFPDEIGQVIINLISNAIDATNGNGKIRIRITKQNEELVVLEIEDTGGGVQVRDQDDIFEPFFTTKEIGKGTGIGLNICKKITEKHKGTIGWININEGALFSVKLPVSPQLN